MLFVDGMNGVINHSETVQWLYTLTGSMHRLVVKTALKLLIVFVEYTESNAQLLIQAVSTVDGKRDTKPWSCLIEILEEKNGADVELLVFTMTLINKTLAALPDQDSFYDLTDCLETQGMENIIHRHMNNKGTDSDLKHQFTLYEIMLFVDGMNGVINHSETVQWLYTLTGSMTALKLLIVFVEYTESNAQLLIQAVSTVDGKRDTKPWSCLIEILEEKNGADVELLVFTMTLINKTLAALPDQDSFYDLTDCLETQGMENIIHRHMNNKGTDSDLKHQFTLYENALRFEDGELDRALPNVRRDRRKLAPSAEEGRKSRRTSGQNMTEATFASTTPSSCASPSLTLESSLPSLNRSHRTPLPGNRASSSQDTGSQSLSPAVPLDSGSPTAASNGIHFPAAELQQSEGTPST
ncbi:UNVERIFIED_CONTAM: hypothetical protein FKN15_071381 [Acipenser sinensis]